jgi:hypothetical protein
MYTLSSFRRRLISAEGAHVDVAISAGEARWLPAQGHSGENIGETRTHVIFVELKEPAPAPQGQPGLGPS